MIDLYTWTVPNGRKISIMLEELGVPYQAHPVDLDKGEQRAPEFLKISPNNKVPAIVDRDNGQCLMESGAILWYLAEKYGKLLPSDPVQRIRVMEWLMWQVGGLGPVAGQAHHYLRHNPGKSEYAEQRLRAEVERLYGVLDRHLDGRDHIAGDYSIADIACWPWVSRYDWHQVDLALYPNVRGWYRRLLAREAVRKGYHVPKHMGEIPPG